MKINNNTIIILLSKIKKLLSKHDKKISDLENRIQDLENNPWKMPFD